MAETHPGTSTDTTTTGSTATPDATVTPTPRAAVANVVSSAETTSKSAKAGVADFAATTKQSLKDGATKFGKEATDKARAYAEDGKTRAGGVLDELSKMMNDAAGTVDEKVGTQYGHYARSAADAVSNFSESLKSKNVDDLVGEARDFARKSPAVAIGAAAALGFVLVRLIKSGLDADDHA